MPKFVNRIKQLSKYNNIMFFISLLCLFLTSTIFGLSDFDFRWQSLLGESIVTKGDFNGLKNLVWGTKGLHTYYDHEWLTNVLFYFLNVIFGHTYSIVAIKVLLEILLSITSYFFVRFFVKDFKNMNLTMYLSIMFLTYLSASMWVKPKAYVISVAFMMLLILLLEHYKEGSITFKKFSIYLLILIIFWNNIHSGSILLIFIITGIYWICFWRDIKIVLLGLVSILVLCINPFGYKLIYFNLTHNFDKVMKTILLDWRGLDFKLEIGVIIGVLFVLMLLFLWNMPREGNYVYLLLYIGFLLMTISSMRHFIYMYPIGLILFVKGQFKIPSKLKFFDIQTFEIPTWFIFIFTVCVLLFFSYNFNNLKREYSMSYITPELDGILGKTFEETNDGLYTSDVDVWSLGYKSFESGAFPFTRDRVIDSFTLLAGSEIQIKDIINYYGLNKFLFFKSVEADTGYKLHTNLYDYMISRPNEYVLLYDDDVLVYFVTKEVNDAIK